MVRMKISAVDVLVLRSRLDEPFAFSQFRYTHRATTLVRIKTDDGAAPKPHVVIVIGGKRRGSLVSLVLSNTRRIRI